MARLTIILPSVLGLCLVAVPTVAAAPSPQTDCAVEGHDVTVEKVTIRPQGAPPFAVSIRGVRATATLPKRSGGVVELQVEEPLSFRAQARNLWLTVGEAYSSPDGLVELHRGAHLVKARREGDTVVGSAVLSAGDFLEGEDKAPEETASFVRVPCRAVVLGGTQEQGQEDGGGAEGEDEAPGTGDWWEFSGNSGQLQLRTGPKLSAPFLLLNAPAVQRLRSEGGWMLVERRGEGVTVRGWVRASQLKRLPEGLGGGGICESEHTRHSWGEGWGPTGPPAGLYQGPARVLAGTHVFAEPPTGEWAVFTAETPVVVRHIKGEKWVELRSIPGLDGSPPGSPWFNAHVAVERVLFPSDDQSDGGR